ncbi:unnamed protein product [Pleuronectes platessa]|uniref:Uncharacterized protein n=1 Tax=Pleuronectes platessa TaxID=8262 RepID=A0A9N7TRH8_PLEPL|nr:unnamed protein product [Pleuronectes platessa]
MCSHRCAGNRIWDLGSVSNPLLQRQTLRFKIANNVFPLKRHISSVGQHVVCSLGKSGAALSVENKQSKKPCQQTRANWPLLKASALTGSCRRCSYVLFQETLSEWKAEAPKVYEFCHSRGWEFTSDTQLR